MLKENVCKEGFLVDKDDSSVTRSDEYLRVRFVCAASFTWTVFGQKGNRGVLVLEQQVCREGLFVDQDSRKLDTQSNCFLEMAFVCAFSVYLDCALLCGADTGRHSFAGAESLQGEIFRRPRSKKCAKI